jgi:hypothetical protein
MLTKLPSRIPKNPRTARINPQGRVQRLADMRLLALGLKF